MRPGQQSDIAAGGDIEFMVWAQTQECGFVYRIADINPVRVAELEFGWVLKSDWDWCCFLFVLEVCTFVFGLISWDDLDSRSSHSGKKTCTCFFLIEPYWLQDTFQSIALKLLQHLRPNIWRCLEQPAILAQSYWKGTHAESCLAGGIVEKWHGSKV